MLALYFDRTSELQTSSVASRLVHMVDCRNQSPLTILVFHDKAVVRDVLRWQPAYCFPSLATGLLFLIRDRHWLVERM